MRMDNSAASVRPRSSATKAARRGLRVTAAALGVAAISIVVAIPATSAAASTIHGLATAHLHLAKAEGSTLIETGPVSGVLVGRAEARLKTGATYSAEFTMSTAAGTITGIGRATPSKAGRYQSFRGSFKALSGTKRYAHIRGEAQLYGVFDRRTDSVVVQTVGTLTY
jgi:hypothetical protein